MASLLLARASGRRGEIIIRSAIGASRWRITRQLLTESLIIAWCAGAVGLFLAYWWTEALTHLQLPFGIPVHLELHPDVRVLGYTLLVAFTTVLLFGMGPALQLSRVSLASGAGRQNSVASRRRSWKARLLIVAQISISLLLLIGAGLCVRSLRNAELIDPGFETRNTLVFSISSRMTGNTGGPAAGFYRDLLERVKRIQGVQSVSLSALVPLGYGKLQETVAINGGSGGTPQRHAVSENLVTPDYFQTLGIPVVRGNTFRNESEARKILVNEAFIRRFLPAQNAIGRQLTLGEGQDARLVQIVGITRDTKYRTLGEAPEPLIYGLLTPGQEGPTGAAVLIRTFRDPEALISTILSQVHALDNSLPPPRIETMTEHIGSALWLAHSMATLFSVLGMIATFLAVIGLYGSVAYSVSSRINEIGVRMALGAQRADILKMIEGEGLFLTCIGIDIGLAAAVALTRFMGNLLYGLSPTDPPTLIGVSLLFILVALAACYIPSRNATRVDPMMALREP
jgi:macrolide transport system ATP-binding/permease protein